MIFVVTGILVNAAGKGMLNFFSSSISGSEKELFFSYYNQFKDNFLSNHLAFAAWKEIGVWNDYYCCFFVVIWVYLNMLLYSLASYTFIPFISLDYYD